MIDTQHREELLSTLPAAQEAAARNGSARLSLLDQTPPHDPKSERGALASIAIDPPRLAGVAKRLRVVEFYDLRHQQIYRAMLATRDKGLAVDSTTIVTELRNVSGMTTQEAVVLVNDLFEGHPSPANCDYFVDIVKENYQKRQACQLAEKLLKAAHRGESITEELELASESLKQIASSGSDEVVPRMERLTCAELEDGDWRQDYLVNDVVPAKQGGIISGRFKTCKTTISADLLISCATGTPFLDQFEVPRPIRVGFISSESGKPTLRDIGRRVCRDRDLELRDVENLIWSTTLPKLSNPAGLQMLERFIDEEQLELVVCDPSYLALCEAADSSSNVFAMGRLLEPITRLIERSGCAVVLVNHNRKHRAVHQKQFDPPELQEISAAGFAEWARWWLLLGPRREWDEDTGQHWLWLRTGGSAGHAGLFCLDATEGLRSDKGGRRWDVFVDRAADRQRDERADAEQRKEAEQQERLEGDIRRIVLAMEKTPDGDTKTAIRDRANVKTPQFNVAINAMLEREMITHCQVVKGNHKTPKDALKLAQCEPVGAVG